MMARTYVTFTVEVTVPAGTDVYIGILPPNIDYNTWGPDAREWKPERWMSPLPQSVGEAHIPGVVSQNDLPGGKPGMHRLQVRAARDQCVLATYLRSARPR